MPLIIRHEQIKAFEEESIRQFRERTIKRLKVFAPRHFELFGEATVRDVVDVAIRQGSSYGLTTESAVYLFVQAMFILGSKFDTDPMFPWAGEILEDQAITAQNQKTDRLYKQLSDYVQKALGKSNEYYFNALRRLRRESLPVSGNLEAHATEALRRISPEKYVYVGETAVKNLIIEAQEKAAAHAMDGYSGSILASALMFFLGHGIFNDPLHPWVKAALKKEERSSTDQRIDRLSSEAMRVLDGCLA